MSIRDDIFSDKLDKEYALKQAQKYILSIEEHLGRQTAMMASLDDRVKELMEQRFRVREAIGTSLIEANKGREYHY